jgi:hypothetical protein
MTKTTPKKSREEYVARLDYLLSTCSSHEDVLMTIAHHYLVEVAAIKHPLIANERDERDIAKCLDHLQYLICVTGAIDDET